MSDFMDIKEVTTRKDHRCMWCGEPIPKGARASRTFGKWQGEVQYRHMHPECEAAYDKLLREDHYIADDGFSPHMFKRGTSEEK